MAILKSLKISCDTLPNFFFSSSSITNDFTTLIPATFSSTTLFKSSYFSNILFIIGCTFLIIKYSPIPTNGIKSKKISDNFTLIERAAHREMININGVLTAILIITWNAFCTFVTSVVNLVIKLLVENLSIFEKENSCTLKYKSCLKFFAKPADAFDANIPATTPKDNDSIAHKTSSIPILYTAFISPL